LTALGFGYTPALTAPGGDRAYQRTYSWLDRMQRRRASVAAERHAHVRAIATRHLERQGVIHGYVGGPPFPLSRYRLGRVPPADPGDPRLSFDGFARKVVSGLRSLRRAVLARRAGRRLPGRYCTTSDTRLEALYTQQRRTFDQGGGAHLAGWGAGLTQWAGP